MTVLPRLVLQSDPSKVASLQRTTPLTIGRAANNRLSLPKETSVSEHHAVVRFSAEQGWLICDWNSSDGTFLDGEKIGRCRQLSDGAAIQLGPSGPVLLFETGTVVADAPPRADATAPIAPTPDSAGLLATGRSSTSNPGQPAAKLGQPARAASRNPSGSPTTTSLDFAGERLPLDQILSATVRSEPRHPHIFSWWLLLCLGGLLLLPFPVLFAVLELTGLAGWIVLGSRKDHDLIVVLRNGLAYRRTFTNRPTALSHRNGIRRALGQTPND